VSAGYGSPEGPDDGRGRDTGRALTVGVAGFVLVHLLALIALAEPSLPELAGVEALALVALVGGDAATTGDGRAAVLVGVTVLAALGAVGVALASAEPWVVAVGVLAVAGGTLAGLGWYDRVVAGGRSA
jgi:hypothetical protein